MMEPENDGFQKESPLSGAHLQIVEARFSEMLWIEENSSSPGDV